MNPKLAAMTLCRAQCVDGSDVNVYYGASGQECHRIAGFNDTQLPIQHLSGRTGSSSTITSALKGVDEMVQMNNMDVRTLCKKGRLTEALCILDDMVRQGSKVNLGTYVCLLQQCIDMNALAEGKRVHAHILKRRFKPNIFLGNTVINMYSKCGSLVDARQVFDKLPEQNLFTWNIMIAGYVRHGHAEEALKLFQQMRQRGMRPSTVTFVSILKSCTILGALEWGKQIHADIINSGFESDAILGNILIDMYAKCGSIDHARQVFDKIPKRDVVSWTAMIAGYAQHGNPHEAFKLFGQMEWEGMLPDKVTFVCILKTCSRIAALAEGKQIHARVIKRGFESDVVVGNTLVDMYAKCGDIEQARQVFDKMPKQSIVSWNILIAGYAQNGHAEEALSLFRQMEHEGVKPNQVTFVSILRACAILGVLEKGKQIHSHVVKCGFESDVFVGSTLVDMYGKCGSIEDARHVFDRMAKRDVVSWTSMIAGYTQHGHDEEAFNLFHQMILEGMKPSEFTFVSMLKACASLAVVEQGKLIHAHIINSGFESNVFVSSALVDMYCKCRSIQSARKVFNKMPVRDVVSWTAMISGYAEHGHAQEAFILFQQMEQEGVKPSEATFMSILKACASFAALEDGRQMHVHIIKCGFESNVFLGSTLVDMYAQCGSMEEARQVFDKLPKQDVVLWNAVIAGYVQHGHAEDVFKLFQQMKMEGVKPDKVTFLSMLKACAKSAALEQGKQIHADIITNGFESDVFVGNSLIDMYAKCGSIEHACEAFANMPKRDVSSWNAMMAGYAQHGHTKEALQLIRKMQQEGTKLDHITFICILSACSRAGLVDEGRVYFECMSQDHGVTPTADHYSCMVDLLCRAGLLEEAEGLIKRMPVQPCAVVWMTLLSACRIYGNVELAEHVVERILELEPRNAAAFVLLSNIYAAAGRWDERARLINLMENRGVEKEAKG